MSLLHFFKEIVVQILLCVVNYSILIKRDIKSINNNGMGVLSYRSFFMQGNTSFQRMEWKTRQQFKHFELFPSIYLPLMCFTRDVLCFGSVVKTCFRHTSRPVSTSLKNYIFLVGYFQENMCWISGCLMVVIRDMSLTFHDSDVIIYPIKLKIVLLHGDWMRFHSWLKCTFSGLQLIETS